jgi:hypothetical protein
MIGPAKNSWLKASGGELTHEADVPCKETGDKPRLSAEFSYAASTCNHQHWVIIKVERSTMGSVPALFCYVS